MDWYERNIEEPVRGLVKHLRNNGVNTTISCGHEMYVQCHWFGRDGIYEVGRLVNDHLAAVHGRGANFSIEGRIDTIDGEVHYTPLRINLYYPNVQKAFLRKEKKRLLRAKQKGRWPKSELFRINRTLKELEASHEDDSRHRSRRRTL